MMQQPMQHTMPQQWASGQVTPGGGVPAAVAAPDAMTSAVYDQLSAQLLAQSPVAQRALEKLSHERDRVAAMCATVRASEAERRAVVRLVVFAGCFGCFVSWPDVSVLRCVLVCCVLQELAAAQMEWSKLTKEREEFEAERAAFKEYHRQALHSQRTITAQLASLKEELRDQQGRLRLDAAQVAAQREILEQEKSDVLADNEAMVRVVALRCVRSLCSLPRLARCSRPAC